MDTLHQLFLKTVSDEYIIQEDHSIREGVCTYRLHHKKQHLCDLLLCNNFQKSYDIQDILATIDQQEACSDHHNSYICIMPLCDATKENAVLFNGRSFVHFVFVDCNHNRVVYDETISYWGSKHIKRVMKIYQECFASLVVPKPVKDT